MHPRRVFAAAPGASASVAAVVDLSAARYRHRVFEGFADERVDVGEVELRVRRGGRVPGCCSCTAIPAPVRPEVWRPWARDLQGEPIDSRHHVAEENPEALVDALVRFLPRS